MTSYLRMMGTGSVRPEGRETELTRWVFKTEKWGQLEDSLLLEHWVLRLENFALSAETRKLQWTKHQLFSQLTAATRAIDQILWSLCCIWLGCTLQSNRAVLIIWVNSINQRSFEFCSTSIASPAKPECLVYQGHGHFRDQVSIECIKLNNLLWGLEDSSQGHHLYWMTSASPFLIFCR